MKLLIQNYKHNKDLTLADFLYLFLTHLNKKYATIYENGEVQCDSFRLRSLGDIFNITKSYFPNVSQSEVKETLLNFGLDLVGHFCSDIKKRVYCHKELYTNYNQGGKFQLDEYRDRIEYRIMNLNILNTDLINLVQLNNK